MVEDVEHRRDAQKRTEYECEGEEQLAGANGGGDNCACKIHRYEGRQDGRQRGSHVNRADSQNDAHDGMVTAFGRLGQVLR